MTRKEARTYIIRHCNPDYPQGKTEWERAVNMAIKALEEPERKKGEWILPNNPIAVSLNEWICSECKYLIDGKHNFCPYCGADMRGEKE